jgi:glucose-1-phosphate thymidylyltransferase
MAVTAVLLAAGYATRLYPLTEDRPKALLPLGSGVILDAVLDRLDTVRGLRERILVTNHRFAGQFQVWQRRHHGAAVHILDDGTDTPEARLGAMKDLELARQTAPAEDDLLVIGTDNLFRWPVADFVAAAQRHRPHPTIALWEGPSLEAARAFGVVSRDRDGRITAFVEKSPQPPSRAVALCVYYFPASMCGKMREFLEQGGNPDAPGYFIQWLVQCETVYGIMMPGRWYDIGTLEAYQAVLAEWPSSRRASSTTSGG